MEEFRWKEFETFDEFLDEFERYVNEYFTKRIILVNRIAIDSYDGGDILVYWLGTPSTDVIIRIFSPDRVVMGSYVSGLGVEEPWLSHADDWNGLVLTKEQFERFDRAFKKALSHYTFNREEFDRGHSEVFMNLTMSTRGKIIDVLEEALGEDTAAIVVAKELRVIKERDGGE